MQVRWFFSYNDGKNIVGLILSNTKDIKNIENVLIESIKETIYYSEDENPCKYSEYGKMEYL